jgi:hypothetical protein
MLSNDEDDIVPGTVHLVDVEGILTLEKGPKAEHNIILQPQPSSNPNDPLRWLKKKKRVQFGLLFFWAFMQAVCQRNTPPSAAVLTKTASSQLEWSHVDTMDPGF